MAKASEGKTGNTALDAVMSQIRKEFGEMSIIRLGDQEVQDIPVISTGALSLDMALGVGGLPRGRIVECYGQESSGKTTLALHVVANAQKAGPRSTRATRRRSASTSTTCSSRSPTRARRR